MAGRRCPGKDEQGDRTITCPRILTNGDRYCARHAAAYEAKRGTPAQRGYGAAHRAKREMWQRRLDAGEKVHCARCGGALTPTQPWALDHSDDRTTYIGPSHKSCNDAAGGRAAHQ